LDHKAHRELKEPRAQQVLKELKALTAYKAQTEHKALKAF
jgi:hypothetical protein